MNNGQAEPTLSDEIRRECEPASGEVSEANPTGATEQEVTDFAAAVTDAPPEAKFDPAKAIDAYLWTILHCATVGAISSMPKVDPAVMLIGISRVLGKVIGQMYAGDPATVTKVRKECRRVFCAEMAQTPIVQWPKQPPTKQ